MAVVGEAHVIVRAITNRVRPDIQKAFTGLDGIGETAGRDVGESFSRGLAKGGSSRGGLFSSKFRKEAEEARVGLQAFIVEGYKASAQITVLSALVGALGGGLLALGAIAGAAAIGGITVLAAGVGALIQSLLTLKLAFNGVAKAISAGNKAAKGSAAQDKAIAAAKRRVGDAALRLKRLQEEAKPELIARLNQRVADSTDNLADAQMSAERGERAYKDAQDKTRGAIEKLNEARDAAREKLQQLKFETEGGAIAEKRARLEFEKARESLQRVQDLPPNSRARKEAELAYAEADLNMRKAIDRNKDLKKETSAAVALGVNGAKEVVAAEKAKNDAQLDEIESAQDLAKMKTQVTKAEVDLQKARDEATNDSKKSIAIRDMNRQIADAVRDQADAEKALKEARQGSGADAYADAMAGLSKEAKTFVEYMVSIQGEFKKLRAAAGEELFPKLETAMQNLVDNLFPKLGPLLKGTGGVLGQMAIDFSSAVTEGTNLTNLESVWKTNDTLLGKLGKSAGGFYGGLLALLAAAKPLIDDFGDWILKLSTTFEKTMKAKQATGELTTFFKNIGRVAGGLGKAFGTAFSVVGDLIANVIEPGGAGDIFVGWLQKITEGWKTFTSGGGANDGLTSFLNGFVTNLTKVGDILGIALVAIGKLGASKEFGAFLDDVKEAVTTIAGIGDSFKDILPSLGEAAKTAATFVKNFADSGAIQAFFDTLTFIGDILNKIFGSAIGQKVLAFTGGIFAITRAFALFGKFGGLAFKGILGTLLKVQGGFVKLKRFITDPFGRLRSGSALARTELQKQMIIDKQKQMAMKGIQISADQAAVAIGLKLPAASGRARGAFMKATGAAKGFGIGAKLAGAGARIGSIGVRAFGSAFSLLGGPLGIIMLILPLIIEHWDEIVAFFKDLIPKLGKIFSDMWGGLTKFLGEAWTNISTWFTQTFVPGLGDFFVKALQLIALILFPLPTLLIKFWPEISNFFTNTVFPWFAALPGKVMEFAGKVWNFLKDAAVIAWDALVTWFTIVWNFYRDLPGKILGFAGKIWNFLSDGAKTAWTLVSGWWTGTVVPWFTGLAGKVLGFAGKVWNFLSDGLKTGWNAAVTFFTTTIPTYLRGLPSKFATALKGLWDGIAGGLKFAWEAAKQWWNQNVASKKLTIGGMKILGVQIPKIELGFPKLAKGGIIPATPGGTMAMIGEAGRAERVEPLDANGLSKRDKAMIDYMSGGSAGGVTIIVNPSAGMDERELADIVSRKLAQQMRRGAA